jgi:hypothetical protein
MQLATTDIHKLSRRGWPRLVYRLLGECRFHKHQC